MSDPYREPGRPVVHEPEPDPNPICNCGHSYDDHHMFNGDTVACHGLGTFNTSKDRKTGEVYRHQIKGFCGCDRFQVRR